MPDVQTSLFDLPAALQARDTGMQRAAKARSVELERAREIARELTTNGRVISADDVQAVLAKEGVDLGNSAGSIFIGGEFEQVGYTKSKRVISHGNLLRTWRKK